jgi:hypothetical protein
MGLRPPAPSSVAPSGIPIRPTFATEFIVGDEADSAGFPSEVPAVTGQVPDAVPVVPPPSNTDGDTEVPSVEVSVPDDVPAIGFPVPYDVSVVELVMPKDAGARTQAARRALALCEQRHRPGRRRLQGLRDHTDLAARLATGRRMRASGDRTCPLASTNAVKKDGPAPPSQRPQAGGIRVQAPMRADRM